MNDDNLLMEMNDRIEALARVLLDDVLMAAPNLSSPVDSFVAAKALGRINAVFARMFYDITPGLKDQFLKMNENELEIVMDIDYKSPFA